MKLFHILAGASIMIIGLQASTAVEQGANRQALDSASVKISQELATQAEIAARLAPIRSREDLVRYMRSTPKDRSPLSALEPGDRANFLHSLKFNEAGLTDFNYLALSDLTPSQVYRILALFGMESGSGKVRAPARSDTDEEVNRPSLRADFEMEKRCDGSKCVDSPQHACTSNC